MSVLLFIFVLIWIVAVCAWCYAAAAEVLSDILRILDGAAYDEYRDK